ncbi:hypothetical protein DLJ82_1748 [Rhizobium leguminosarum]|uniref:Uncharacterized protein n=1 Tax=Rhizobium leguminosarum TaxID=384 RepID=A0A2Z4YDB5_RHILE|nr:hypothetical protein DLJ82_1748 [Rhizobium leguminosarum]
MRVHSGMRLAGLAHAIRDVQPVPISLLEPLCCYLAFEVEYQKRTPGQHALQDRELNDSAIATAIPGLVTLLSWLFKQVIAALR